MKIDKAESRDKKRRKARNGMVVTGRSVFIVQSIQIKKAEKAKGKKNGNRKRKTGK